MHEEVIYASEQSFIKVSLEEIKTQTKQNQRTLEKELSLILAFFNSKATSQSTKENNNCATIEATCEILQKAAEAAKKRLFEVKEKVLHVHKREFLLLFVIFFSFKPTNK